MSADTDAGYVVHPNELTPLRGPQRGNCREDVRNVPKKMVQAALATCRGHRKRKVKVELKKGGQKQSLGTVGRG